MDDDLDDELQGNITITPEPSEDRTLKTGFKFEGDAARLLRRRLTDRSVNLGRSTTTADANFLLWYVIKRSTEGLAFKNYLAYMDFVMCGDETGLGNVDDVEEARIRGPKSAMYSRLKARRTLPYTDTDAYRLLKAATEAFLTVNCGVPLVFNQGDDPAGGPLEGLDLEKELDKANVQPAGNLLKEWWTEYLVQINGSGSRTVPYLELIRQKLRNERIADLLPGQTTEEDRLCAGILVDKLASPCFIELIWSYWHEQGMLVQTMNALSRRFQNLRGPAAVDPLAMVEIDPLRPLNNLMWGYVQDEQHRLSLVRRVYEYDHHYGLTLEGRAVPELRPADSRGRFLETFHNLLHAAASFYKQDDDTTFISDAFEVLNALKAVHILLSEGAHNQFGDMPFTARVEMLMQQWLLARPEFREALPTRIMVANPEAWMDRVDAMKRLQGWDQTNALHYRNLAVWGEQILLSARFGAWSDIEDDDVAKVWARFFRPQIKGYIHAYLTVTGVDLTADAVVQQQRQLIITQPSRLIRQRLEAGQKTAALPAPAPAVLPAPEGFRQRRAVRRLPSGGGGG